MRHARWLIAAGLIAATTAGCTQTTGYSSPAYVQSGYDSGYYSNPSYYGTPTYYSQSYYPTRSYYTSTPVVTQTRYVPVPAPRRAPLRDSDRDGVPNRWDRYDNNPRRY
jgi:hypothetical protein